LRIAIIENGIVTNIIEGELETVESLFEQVALETETTNSVWIGARYNGEKFEAKNAFDSWTWNEETFDYDPPIDKPVGDYYWNEAGLEWLPTRPPVELDPETGEPIEPEPSA
jgi:hypothetical protein